MIELKTISVRRLDKAVVHQFFNADLGIKEHTQKNFQDNGKLVSMSTSISQDYSTETKTLVFKTRENYFEFINDEVLRYQEDVIRTRYNSYHDINSSKTTTEI